MAYITYDCGTSTTSSTWTVWNSGSTTATSVTSSTNVIWPLWVDGTGEGATFTTTNLTGTVWLQWAGTGSNTTYIRQHELTEEEILRAAERQRRYESERPAREAARIEEAAKADEQWKKQREEKAAADKRAEELLLRHLDAEQRESYAAEKAFHVVSATGKRYKIRNGWSGNVDEINEAGQAFMRYCIHPKIGVPTPDNMLAQKLMLETREDDFRRIANKTPLQLANTG